MRQSHVFLRVEVGLKDSTTLKSMSPKVMWVKGHMCCPSKLIPLRDVTPNSTECRTSSVPLEATQLPQTWKKKKCPHKSWGITQSSIQRLYPRSHSGQGNFQPCPDASHIYPPQKLSHTTERGIILSMRQNRRHGKKNSFHLLILE